jgi:hypothetical protein
LHRQWRGCGASWCRVGQGNPILDSLIVEYDRDMLSPTLLSRKLYEQGFAIHAHRAETRSFSPHNASMLWRIETAGAVLALVAR